MKTIRHGVFETNSSSEHSVTVHEELFTVPKAQYDQFKSEKAFFDKKLEKVVTVKHVFTEFVESKWYKDYVAKNKCSVLNTDSFMKIATEVYYWSHDMILKKFKKAKITQFHITGELTDKIGDFLKQHDYCSYHRYASYSPGDDNDFVEKEIQVTRHTTVVTFGHAWANCD